MPSTTRYEERDANLKKMGFKSYAEYLAHPIWWRVLRPMVMKRARGVCQSCGINKATAVHHTSYSVKSLLGHRMKNLVAVCDMCHELAHESELTGTHS